jgi:hypothetical protein
LVGSDNTAAAVERGVFGVPTFFVESEMFFGKERLGQPEEAGRGDEGGGLTGRRYGFAAYAMGAPKGAAPTH